MLDRRAFLSLVLAGVSSVGLAFAAPMKSSTAGPSARSGAPAEFAPQIDTSLTTSIGPAGREWAAWAYRSSGEFDVAVAYRDGIGSWSSPLFVGRRDLVDEVEPAIAVDGLGTVYVAYATRGSRHVSLAVLPVGSSTWLGPTVISGTQAASAPAIRIVGDRLIVAFRAGTGVGISELRVGASAAQIFGIQDGPDGVDPLGVVPKWGDRTGDDDLPPPME